MLKNKNGISATEIMIILIIVIILGLETYRIIYKKDIIDKIRDGKELNFIEYVLMM
jgi:hypothetical protein